MEFTIKTFLGFALVSLICRKGMACSDSSCTVVQGNVKKEFGDQGSQTVVGGSVQHQMKLGDNTAIAGSLGREHISGNGGTITSLTKGIEGSYKSGLGVSGIKFSEKSFSNGDSFRDTTLTHGFRPTDNLKLTGLAGISTANVGGVRADGRTFGLQGEGVSKLGTTNFGLSDSVLKAPGLNKHTMSGTLRHDVPVFSSSSLGASVQGSKTDFRSFSTSGTGFGVHGSTKFGQGTTSLDLTRDRLNTPFGRTQTDTLSLGHQIPVSDNAFVKPYASHSWMNTPSGRSSNSALGFGFGWKF